METLICEKREKNKHNNNNNNSNSNTSHSCVSPEALRRPLRSAESNPDGCYQGDAEGKRFAYWV